MNRGLLAIISAPLEDDSRLIIATSAMRGRSHEHGPENDVGARQLRVERAMRTANMIDMLTLACALGCGLMAGFFFAFSVCVMTALGRLPPAQGVAAMQSINVVVINPWFLTVFLGLVGLGALAAILAFADGAAARAQFALAGAILYTLGTFIVTMRLNVPLNNALAAVAADSSEAAALWVRYLSEWTTWNHLRTIAALAATAAFCLALRTPAG
jgi:uncharacterized membrane protein